MQNVKNEDQVGLRHCPEFNSSTLVWPAEAFADNCNVRVIYIIHTDDNTFYHGILILLGSSRLSLSSWTLSAPPIMCIAPLDTTLAVKEWDQFSADKVERLSRDKLYRTGTKCLETLGQNDLGYWN